MTKISDKEFEIFYFIENERKINMQITFVIIVTLLISIIFYQQHRIKEMEDRVFLALKKTCETLNLIKKDATIEDILTMRRGKN